MNISYRFLIDLTWVQKKNTLNIFVSYFNNDIWTDYVPCNLYRLRMPSKYLHFFISPDGSENFFKFLANQKHSEYSEFLLVLCQCYIHIKKVVSHRTEQYDHHHHFIIIFILVLRAAIIMLVVALKLTCKENN